MQHVQDYPGTTCTRTGAKCRLVLMPPLFFRAPFNLLVWVNVQTLVDLDPVSIRQRHHPKFACVAYPGSKILKRVYRQTIITMGAHLRIGQCF
jgi:hypothetical protein